MSTAPNKQPQDMIRTRHSPSRAAQLPATQRRFRAGRHRALQPCIRFDEHSALLEKLPIVQKFTACITRQEGRPRTLADVQSGRRPQCARACARPWRQSAGVLLRASCEGASAPGGLCAIHIAGRTIHMLWIEWRGGESAGGGRRSRKETGAIAAQGRASRASGTRAASLLALPTGAPAARAAGGGAYTRRQA